MMKEFIPVFGGVIHLSDDVHLHNGSSELCISRSGYRVYRLLLSLHNPAVHYRYSLPEDIPCGGRIFIRLESG